MDFGDKMKDSMKCKCPNCGNTQDKQGVKETQQMQMFRKLLELNDAHFVVYVVCKKCGKSFLQDDHIIK